MTVTRQDEIVTEEEWQRAKTHGYARIWDGYHYMLRLDRETGTIVWRPVNVIRNVSKRRRNSNGN